jgi:SAM-dependent methyltransferase
MHEYTEIAHLYAQDFADVDEDIAFYRSLARHLGGSVLELMCGTGRVCVPLAQAGCTTVGVDASEAMLAIAQRSLAANPHIPLTLHHGDVRHWQSEQRFRLAIIALNSFMHFTNITEQMATLQNVHGLLSDQGTLVIDVFHPDMRSLPHYQGDMVLDKQFTMPDGRHVQKFVSQWSNVMAQIIQVVFMYDVIDASRQVQRFSATFAMRYFWRFEIEHLLARCGFVVQEIYGGYDLEPFDEASTQMIVVATKHNQRT